MAMLGAAEGGKGQAKRKLSKIISENHGVVFLFVPTVARH
jgi:hypothetical protein